MLISLETGVEKLTETGRCNDGSQAADTGTHTNTILSSHWPGVELSRNIDCDWFDSTR